MKDEQLVELKKLQGLNENKIEKLNGELENKNKSIDSLELKASNLEKQILKLNEDRKDDQKVYQENQEKLKQKINSMQLELHQISNLEKEKNFLLSKNNQVEEELKKELLKTELMDKENTKLMKENEELHIQILNNQSQDGFGQENTYKEIIAQYLKTNNNLENEIEDLKHL